MTEVERWWFRVHAADTDMAFPYDPDQTGRDFEALEDADAAANIEAFQQIPGFAPASQLCVLDRVRSAGFPAASAECKVVRYRGDAGRHPRRAS